MATVSVIIPAYNQARYLGEAIQSVLDQTYQDFEIAVVDDGSTDNTREVVERFSDQRIHYIYQENRGLSVARNTGIRHTAAPFVTFLDSDDLFLPEKLAVLLELFELEPDIGIAAGQAISIDENGVRIRHTLRDEPPEWNASLLLGNPFHVGSVLLRRSWLKNVGHFDEAFRAYEDWDLWLRLAKAGCRFGWAAQPVSLYRFHKTQMTREPERLRQASSMLLAKNFNDSELPREWRRLCERAYATAHLRTAAQAYRAGAIRRAKADLDKAVRLWPELAADGGDLLARQIFAWADDPRTTDRLSFVDRVYQNLPAALSGMRRHRRTALAQLATRLGFESYERQNWLRSRSYFWHALRYQPASLMNRGLVAILLRSYLARGAG